MKTGDILCGPVLLSQTVQKVMCIQCDFNLREFELTVGS